VRFSDLLRVALRALRAHPLRAGLNLLGIVIAVTTIIAVISVVTGLNRYASDVFGRLGPNTMIFSKFGLITSREAFLEAVRRRDFTVDDVEAVKRLVPQALRVTGRVFSTHPTYAEGRRLPNTFVIGTGPEMPYMVGMELDDGRYFNASEAEASRPVAVIGWDLKDELFPFVDPIGRMIKIEGKPFRVIGTLKRQGQAFGQSQDTVALIPLGAFQKAFGRQQTVDIVVEAPDTASQLAVEDAVRLVLRARRGTPPSAPDPFGMVTAEALQTFWRQFTFSAFALVVLVSSISLVVGGVAIANTLFASVVERTREIGVRKALGARRRRILSQFVVEAVTLSLLGGVLGVLLGAIVAVLAREVWGIPSSIPAWAVVLSLLSASGAGLVFGIYPAYRASRLDPVEAMRTE